MMLAGASRCQHCESYELTGCDMRTPEGQARFKDCDLHHTLCRKLVASAVELLEES